MGLETYSFGQMASEAAGLVRDTSTPARVKLKTYLRHAYAKLANEYTWSELQGFDELGLRKRDDGDSETFQQSSAYFPAPWDSARVLGVTIWSPRSAELELVSPVDLVRRAGAYPNITGLPCVACRAGVTAQHVALAADSVLTVKSSDADNNSTNNVMLSYETATGQSGRVVDELIRGGNYTTGIATSSVAQVGWPVRSVSIPSQWGGDVTIEDASGNVIVDLEGPEGGGEATDKPMVFSRELMRVWPVPDADYQGTVLYQRHPRILARDADVPEIPVSPAMVAMAAAMFLRQQNRPQEAVGYDFMARDCVRALVGSQGRQRIRVGTSGILGMTGTPHPRWYGNYG